MNCTDQGYTSKEYILHHLSCLPSSSPSFTPTLLPGIPAEPLPILLARSSSSASSSNLRIRSPIRLSIIMSSRSTLSFPSSSGVRFTFHQSFSSWTRRRCCSHVWFCVWSVVLVLEVRSVDVDEAYELSCGVADVELSLEVPCI